MDPLLENEEILSLRIEREKREYGLEAVVKIEQREDELYLVVLEDDDGDYHCHRYVRQMFNNEWDCSFDAEEVGVDKVFEWLNDPRAL